MEQVRRPIGIEEFTTAMGSIRIAKNLFWTLILLAVLSQVAAFVLVRYMGVIDHAPQLAQVGVVPESAPATRPATAATSPTTSAATHPAPRAAMAPSERARLWYEVLEWVLPVGKFAALAAGMLLALTLLLAVEIALLGRIGGVAGFTSAMFWSLILLVFLIPWQQILVASNMSGALFNLEDLVSQTRPYFPGTTLSEPGTVEQLTYYLRFALYPAAALLVLSVVQFRFMQGYERVTLSIAQANLSDGEHEEKL